MPHLLMQGHGNYFGGSGAIPTSLLHRAKPYQRLVYACLLSTPPPNSKLVGAEGFEPPTYWFQTSHADQTALRPVIPMPVSENRPPLISGSGSTRG